MGTISLILGTILAFAFSASLGWIVTTALRSGIARIAGGRKFKREKNPILYWITVVVQLTFTIVILFAGINRLMDLYK